jgi:transposase
VFKQWLAERPQTWKDRIDVIAMDGFAGYKTAASEEPPEAVPVMDPFHVVRLAGDALDRCQRIVAAYRTNDKKTGKTMMQAVIDSISHDVPQLLTVLYRLGRTLKQRAADILAFFDRPGSSIGPDPRTAPLKLSTADSSTSAAQPWASET